MIKQLNKYQSYFTSHILLYHSTFSRIPADLKQSLHNVTPDVMYEQIKWIKQYFDVVDVDDLFSKNDDITGKVAITFDDAYQSVFTEAIPVIESLRVPCTIYVNGISLSGKPFWRDLIRFLINNKMIDDFLQFHSAFCSKNNITATNFYRATKKPSVNSMVMSDMIDDYLESNEITLDDLSYCVTDKNAIVKNSLVSYGNHTYSHYVLSSLNQDQQEAEIKRNDDLLSQCDVKLSKVFSVPFGGDKDFNTTTIELLAKHNYKGFLYSRNILNIKGRNETYSVGGSTIISRERYMASDEFSSFQKKIFKLGIKGIVKAIRE